MLRPAPFSARDPFGEYKPGHKVLSLLVGSQNNELVLGVSCLIRMDLGFRVWSVGFRVRFGLLQVCLVGSKLDEGSIWPPRPCPGRLSASAATERVPAAILLCCVT